MIRNNTNNRERGKGGNQQFSKFADYYDAIYNQIVDYESQTSFLEGIFKRFRKEKTRSILDIGCGTGNFTIQFAKRGYDAIGIDLSSDMIRVAEDKRKALGKSENLRFHEMDMRGIRIRSGKQFDAATVLFGGFGYLTEYADVRKFLQGVRPHVAKDGLLIFEFWHVSGVRPETSSKTGYVTWQKVEDRDRIIIRLDANKYDPQSNICRVLFDFYVINRRTKVLIDSFAETHRLKLYSMSEVKNLLEQCGYKSIGFFKDSPGSSGEIEPAEQSSFRVLAVASPS